MANIIHPLHANISCTYKDVYLYMYHVLPTKREVTFGPQCVPHVWEVVSPDH